MIPVIDNDLCTGCERCMDVCPPQAISMDGGRPVIEDEFCEECGFCAGRCPAGAIRIVFPMGEGQ